METGGSGDAPGDAGGESTAASVGDEGEDGDADPQSSGDPGSTSSASSGPGSEATSASGSEGGSEGVGTSGGPLTEHDYGPCTGGDPKAPCGDDAECIVVEGFDGSFCSPWCDEDLACPGPTSGEAFSQCQLGPDLMMPPVHCALLCEPGSDECPDGMNCVDTGMPVGICLFQ
jgi:hypothetical protein